MKRRSSGLRSPAANCFYPEHAPTKEAVYISPMSPSKSMPAVPTFKTEAFEKRHNYLKMVNEQKLARSEAFVNQARKEGEQLAKVRAGQRVTIEKDRKQEKLDRVRHMRTTNDDREKRWGEKLTDHPFTKDLWKEDVQIYDVNRVRDATEQKRRTQARRREIEDTGKQLKKKCSEVDELDLLRKERKLLIETHKSLKTRLDIQRKNERFGISDMSQTLASTATLDDSILRNSSFTISPTRHGAFTCTRPKLEESSSLEKEAVCPLEESAEQYYTKWSVGKNQIGIQGSKDAVDGLHGTDSADLSTILRSEVFEDPPSSSHQENAAKKIAEEEAEKRAADEDAAKKAAEEAEKEKAAKKIAEEEAEKRAAEEDAAKKAAEEAEKDEVADE